MNAAGYDFVILDGELLPWAFKGQQLIDREFLLPGECAVVSRKVIYGEDSPEYKRAQEYMSTLSCHIQHTPLEYRIFQILAAGRITRLGTMELSVLGDHLEAQKRLVRPFSFLLFISHSFPPRRIPISDII